MKYEWDATKNQSNLEKHGVGFEQAKHIFAHPILERPDPRDYGDEQRFIALGHNGKLGGNGKREFFIVVYTWRKNIRRIISLRKAGSHERRAYEERYGEL